MFRRQNSYHDFFLRIKEIDAIIHETSEYVKVSIYFSNTKENEQILINITREIHFVKDFKIN